MENTIVKVIGMKKGKLKRQSYPSFGIGMTPTRFKLSNGHYANAGNLKPI